METNSNKLYEIDKRNPFTVPEDYFATINHKIMSRLPEKEMAAKPKTVPMWDKVKPWIYMAAMFLGLFFTIQVLTKTAGIEKNTNNKAMTLYAEDYWSNVHVSEEEFYQYLEDQIVTDGYYDYMYNQVSN